jgi:N-acetylglucosamine-6-phosphate deacetylase
MKHSWIAKHWSHGQTVKLTTAGGRIVNEGSTDDSTDFWIAPGLIDVQVNGIGGFDLNGMDTTVETVQEVVRYLQKGGVTRFCPTIVTGPRERMLHCIRTIAAACTVDPIVDYAIIGIHVEGPFLSEEDGPRGAHNKNWIRDPDWQEFEQWDEAAAGKIAKVTIAPEKPGAIDFIRKLKQRGIVASIGHCHASEEIILQAVDAGASMSTHLGNGAHPYIKRHPNYIWSQLADDRLWAGLIADGFHLPASTLKVMIRTKGTKAILVSDAVNLAGMPPGRYATPLNDDVVLEPNGFLHLAETPDILAGAALPLYIGIQNVVKLGIAAMEEAIRMASLHPAQLFGLDGDGLGSLDVGAPADFIVYRFKEGHLLDIVQTVANGIIVYEA